MRSNDQSPRPTPKGFLTRRVYGLIALLCLNIAPDIASAQSNIGSDVRAFDANLMRVSSERMSILGALPADIGRPRDADVAFIFDYMRNPLTIRDMNIQDPEQSVIVDALLKNRMDMTIAGAYNILRNLKLFGALPITLFQDRGALLQNPAFGFESIPTTGIGAMRLGARYQLTHTDNPFALQFEAELPTDTPQNAYLGSNAASYSPEFMYSKRIFFRALMHANLGATFTRRIQDENLGFNIGSRANARVGLLFAAQPFLIKSSLSAIYDFGRDEGVSPTGIELRIGIDAQINKRFSMEVGAASGTQNGSLVPEYRLLAGLRWSAYGPPKVNPLWSDPRFAGYASTEKKRAQVQCFPPLKRRCSGSTEDCRGAGPPFCRVLQETPKIAARDQSEEESSTSAFEDGSNNGLRTFTQWWEHLEPLEFCPQESPLEFFFEDNSDRIQRSNYDRLDRFAATLHQRNIVDRASLVLIGYQNLWGEKRTDRVRARQSLTLRRLAAIKEYLAFRGLNVQRIQSVSLPTDIRLKSNASSVHKQERAKRIEIWVKRHCTESFDKRLERVLHQGMQPPKPNNRESHP